MFTIIKERGLASYDALSSYHYRAGRPRAIAGVWTAKCNNGEVLGTLVVCHAPLNSSWRTLAWPGHDVSSPRWLAANVRRIARIVVVPAMRGTGVAKSLLDHYLCSPITPRTEVVAAIAPPLFASCGMREVTGVNPCKRDTKLAEALNESGIEPWQLADTAWVCRVLCSSARNQLRSAFLTWLDASKHSRMHVTLRSRAGELAFAASRLVHPARVWVADPKP